MLLFAVFVLLFNHHNQLHCHQFVVSHILHQFKVVDNVVHSLSVGICHQFGQGQLLVLAVAEKSHHLQFSFNQVLQVQVYSLHHILSTVQELVDAIVQDFSVLFEYILLFVVAFGQFDGVFVVLYE
jgi:hypothetical protein